MIIASGPIMSPISMPQRCIMTLVLLLVTFQSYGQVPQARLDWIFPAGLQAGTSAEIQMSGADLEGTTRLLFSHQGFSAKPASDGKWTINASSDLPAGFYEVRTIGGWGISNPVTIVVGVLKESREAEPNNPKPQEISLPISVQGQIQAATDVDIYSFEGQKGKRIVIDVLAERLDSPLDGTLRLYGPDGAIVAENQDSFGYDPSLELILPADGHYELHLTDAVYSGSPAHIYRLNIHDGPVVDTTLPLAVESGKDVVVKVLGRGFNASADSNYEKVSGFPEESLSSRFAVPSSPVQFNHRPNDSNADATTRLWFHRVADYLPPLVVPMPLAVANGPVVTEIESNDDPKTAQQIDVPCDFSGVFQKPGDFDHIAFRATKDQQWVIESVAVGQNSLAVPEISILKRNDDLSTKSVAELSEQLANPFGPVFETATIDRSITWKAPEDGTYILKISDFSRKNGDARYYYRIVIRQPRPDFQIIALPAGATRPTGISLLRSGRGLVQVLVDRKDGFNQPIRVTAKDLPPGVKAYPLIFEAGQNSQNMVLEVAPDAQISEFPLRLIGESHWSDLKESVDWVPGQKRESEFQTALNSRGGGLVRPLVGPNNQQRGISRYQEDLLIAIRETPVPFSLETESPRLFIKRGTEFELELRVLKHHGFDDKVALRLDNLPAKMDAVTGEIAKGQTSAKLKLKVGANVPLGRHTVYFNGTAPFPFHKDPKAKDKKNITWNIPSRPFTLIVTP
jgi:hypothetical protein